MRDGRRTSPRASQCRLRLPTVGLFLATALASACETSTVSVVEVSEVEVSPPRITLLEGGRETATVALRANGGAELSGRAVEWTVNDPEVATVSSEGVVEGQAPGQTSVHAMSEGVSGSAEVTVLSGPQIEVSSPTIDFDASADDSGVITRDVEVRNAGNGTLGGLTTWVSGSGGASTAWLDTELVGSSAPTKLRLHVRAEGLEAGSYEARAIVQSSSARNGAAEVRVRLTVFGPEPEPDEEEDEPDPDPEPESSCDIRDRTLGDDVEIPRNTTCTFTNVRVLGDVELRRGSRLIGSYLTVDGDIKADRADELVLTNSRVDDKVEFKDGGSVTIRDSYIDGDIVIESNRGSIDVRDSRIEDKLSLKDNRGGPFVILRNTISGDLECSDNEPPPGGGGNAVDGDTKGQCRGF